MHALVLASRKGWITVVFSWLRLKTAIELMVSEFSQFGHLKMAHASSNSSSSLKPGSRSFIQNQEDFIQM
jgi:hypothetical protein